MCDDEVTLISSQNNIENYLGRPPTPSFSCLIACMSQSDLSSSSRQIQNARPNDRSSSTNPLHDRPPTVNRNRSESLLEQPFRKAHTVVDTVKMVFQDDPEVLDARTIRNVERTQNENGKVILRTVISVHYVGHADKQWPSWPWSKSPVMHEEMPPEMHGLVSNNRDCGYWRYHGFFFKT